MDRPDTARVVVGVLGWIRASVDGVPIDLGGPRQQALLAALAARGAGRTMSNDVLIDAVWDGDPPDAAAETLRSYVARLRRSFDRAGVEGTAVVQTVSGGYRLEGATAVDADAFEAEVAEARALLERGELAHVIRLTGRALDRWEGPAFDGVAERQWAAPAAVRLEELRRDVTELRARALLDTDRVAEAVALLEQHVRAEPLREEAVRLQALALYRAGRDADSLRILREFRSRMVDDHGLDPSEQLSELEELVLHRDPRLDRPVVGRRLRGYVVHEPIANSPLGTVHRGEQPSIGREVAVTVLPPSVADDPEVVRAFETRLQAVAGLHHPHVLPIYDYWREPGGAYVVTRLPAATLREALDTGDMTAADALLIGEQVASAVAAAHERGIVHGAPDPEAVVVDERGDVYLWAFPLVPEPALPAADVAAVAALVATVAAHDRGSDGGDIHVETLPARARTVLARAADPAGGPVVTATGLAAALAAVRAGTSEPTVATEFIGPNPYRGLAAFQEADAGVFFGRETLVEQLLARIRRKRAVAVVGPSGAGKSSVVRAGVVPRLRADAAFVTTMVPGARPLDELEIALARVAAIPVTDAADTVVGDTAGLARLVRRLLPTPGADLVLVIDQFEELFTQSDPTERDLFLAALADVVADHEAPVRVVATLRADFLDAVLEHPTAARFVRDRTVMVAPLDDDELHEVITGPAEVAGAIAEPALVTALVADATRARGSLPMVQFALTEAFTAADDGVMRLETYRRIGGIEGVLGQRAEEVFASLDADGQKAARLLFLRLVAPQRDGPTTRRRALRSELAHVPNEVIESFGRARLLRFDRDDESREPTVEVGHEAVFVAWPRLAQWIEEGEDDLRTLGHLTAAATTWDERGREASELYRGTRLAAAQAFADTHNGQLSATETAFLDESRRRETAAAASTRRTTRRTRRLVAGLAVVVLLAVAGGILALDQRRSAQSEQAARDLAAAALDVTADDPGLGMLLALEAVERSPRPDGAVLPEVASALHLAVTSFRGTLAVEGAGGRVDWHPDGTVFATAQPTGSPGRVDLRDAATGASISTIAAHPVEVLDVAFSPDGTRLATAGADGRLRVWDVDTEELVSEVVGRGEAWGISFSLDGARIAAAWHAEALVRVHELTTGGATLDVPANLAERQGGSTAFDPEGRRLAIAVDMGGALVVDVRDGATLRRLDGSTAGVESVAWSPDGRWIAVGGGGGGPGVVDAVTGERHASLDGHDGLVWGLDWHPDGGRVATAAGDGVLRVFEVTTRGAEELLSVATGDAVVTTVAFSPDGDRLLSGDVTTADAAVWDLGPKGAAEVVNLPTARDQQTDAAFGPDGSVVVSGETTRAVVWDLATGTLRTRLGEHRYGAARDVEVSPDGAQVVTVHGYNKPREVQSWDTRTGEERFASDPHRVAAWAASWRPDGDRFAVHGLRIADEVATIAILDRRGEHVTTLVGDLGRTDAVQDAAFVPGGQRLVTVVGHPGGETGRVLLWDTASGAVTTELPVTGAAVTADPSGSRIAVRMLNGGVSIWDADSAQRVLDLDGHSGRVLDMAFSPDGTLMATSGVDGTIRLWSTASGIEQVVLRGHDGPVWSVAFSPDGRRLISTGGGLARVWTLDLDELVQIAEARLTRSLTEAECRRYLDTPSCPE